MKHYWMGRPILPQTVNVPGWLGAAVLSPHCMQGNSLPALLCHTHEWLQCVQMLTASTAAAREPSHCLFSIYTSSLENNVPFYLLLIQSSFGARLWFFKVSFNFLRKDGNDFSCLRYLKPTFILFLLFFFFKYFIVLKLYCRKKNHTHTHTLNYKVKQNDRWLFLPQLLTVAMPFVLGTNRQTYEYKVSF